MKRILACALVALSACATRTHYVIEGGGIAPGADTHVDIARAEGGRRIVRVEVRHLPPPERLGLDLRTYAVWMAPAGSPLRSVGRLAYDRDRRAGALTILTPYPRFRLLVTAEPWPPGARPGPVVIVDQDVSG